MTTVIGFIPCDGICPAEVTLAEVTLPVGFLKTKEGWQRTENKDRLADCTLIFLEDADYDLDACWNCFQGNERVALLFQHNSNSYTWNNQTEWLQSHGWNPRRFAGFSRTENEGEFMKTTKKLLCNNGDCHQTVIEDFLRRVDGKYLFKLLDNYVAWEILASLNKDNDETFEKLRNDAFDLLPEYIKKKLPESPLTEVINAANKQAFDLIQ